MKIAICVAILVAYVVTEHCKQEGPVHDHHHHHHNGSMECNHTMCVHNYTKVCHNHECSCMPPRHHNHTADKKPCSSKSDCPGTFCAQHTGGHVPHCFDNFCVCMQM